MKKMGAKPKKQPRVNPAEYPLIEPLGPEPGPSPCVPPSGKPPKAPKPAKTVQISHPEPKIIEPPHPASFPIQGLCILNVLSFDLLVWTLTFLPEGDLLNMEISCTTVQRACNQIFPLLCDAATKSTSFAAMRHLVRKPYKETPENEAQAKEKYLKQARQIIPCRNCNQNYRQISNTPTSCETFEHPGILKDDNTYTCCGLPLRSYRVPSSFASRVGTPGCKPVVTYHYPNVDALHQRMCLLEAKLELEMLKKPADASFLEGLKARTEHIKEQAQQAEDDDNYTENEW